MGIYVTTLKVFIRSPRQQLYVLYTKYHHNTCFIHIYIYSCISRCGSSINQVAYITADLNDHFLSLKIMALWHHFLHTEPLSCWVKPKVTAYANIRSICFELIPYKNQSINYSFQNKSVYYPLLWVSVAIETQNVYIHVMVVDGTGNESETIQKCCQYK